MMRKKVGWGIGREWWGKVVQEGFLGEVAFT